MSEPGKAVFLSYASQDAEAARRICDALRAAGVEVWFDAEGGLEHGDEWDAKIRRQIKECVLFLPIISASTQAREEGYFRIEWELAAQRALGIASGVAFILPIVIDDTREPDALVPDRFRTVQWTRLRGGELTPEVKARFLKLWSHRTGALKHDAMEAGRPRPAEQRGGGTPPPPKPSWKVYAGLAVAIFSLVAVVGWWMLRRDTPAVPPSVVPPPAVATGPSPAGQPTASARDWPKDPELKKAFALLTRIDMIPEDIRLAEEICQHALDKASTDPEVVAMAAAAQSMWLQRGWDRSNERFLKAQRLAERALQLSPDEPEAMLAMVFYLYQRGTGLERAHELIARAIALNPNEPRYHRMRDNLLFVDPAVPREKALASAVQTVARFPRDALVHYELARLYRNSGRWEDFERETDAALALAPVANALVWKARAQGILHSDLAGMKATLDRVPDRLRTIERTVYAYFLYSVMSGSLGEGIAALNGMADSWMIDFDYHGPKALPLAALLELQGKPSLARLQYEVALDEIKKHQVEAPEDASLWLNQAFVLHGLGRDQEARAINKVYLESLQRPYRISPMSSWWFHIVPCCLLLGERTVALELMREAAEGPAGRATLRARMTGDPRMAPFRDEPEIKALLAEPVAIEGQTSHGLGRATGPGSAAADIGKAEEGGQEAGKAAAPTPARELVAKARALVQGLEATREDYALAEDYCQRALKLDPTDGEVWAAYAQLHSAFGYRGWDLSPERREQNRVMAERAIRLTPDSVQAKLAQAGAWSAFGINRPETEKLLRDVVAEQPDNQVALRFLAVTVLNQGKLEECLALNERSAALPGGDPLALFNNARYLWQRGRRAEAYVIMQRSLAQKPFSSALTFMTIMEIMWRGDVAAAEATLQQIPQSELLEDRANYTAGLLRYYQRRPDAALAAWGAFPRDYYMDFAYDGPKGLLIGLADEMDHRDAAAKIEWRTALALVERRIATAPNKPEPYYYKAYLLACLGEKTAAEEALRTNEELAGIKYTSDSEMTLPLARLYARLGRFDKIFAQSPGRFAASLRIDPAFDGLRDDPRYAGLLKEFEQQKAGATK